MTQELQTLGKYIGEVMAQNNRTRDEIADAIGITGSSLSQLKANKYIPSPELTELLIRALHLDPEETFRLRQEADERRRAEKSQKKVNRVLEEVNREVETLQLDVYQGGFSKHRGPSTSRRTTSGGGSVTLPVMVINHDEKSAYDVYLDILQGPSINEDGMVSFRLKDSAHKDILPETFLLDVIFLYRIATPDESYREVRVGPREKRQLRAQNGFSISVQLPKGPGWEELQQSLVAPPPKGTRTAEGRSVRPLGAFAFRIRSIPKS